jgi:hypothetical protein
VTDYRAEQIVEVHRWVREHDYVLITQEQFARFASILGGGAVPWEEHRRAVTKVEAENDRLRALAHAVDAYLAGGRSTEGLRGLYAAWEGLREIHKA